MFYDSIVRLLVLLRPDILFELLYQLPWYRELLWQGAESLDLRSSHRALEVGCGTGALTRDFLDQGVAMEGIDRSARMIKAARRHDSANSQCYHLGDVLALPFEDGTFDIVFAASLINVVSDPAAVLAQVKRVLRPGGQVGFLVPTRNMDMAAAISYINAHRLKRFSAASLRAWANFAPKSDEKQIEALLQECGFENITVTKYLSGMVAFLYATKSQANESGPRLDGFSSG